jgi:anti-sigma regulatory factor (Ser/Thr protein kinase)
MKIVHVLSIMDGVAGTVLSSLILAPVLGAAGVWIAHVLNGVYTLAAVVVYSCMHRRKIPHSIEDLLAIPEDFGVAEDQRLDISIHNETEVTETSQLVMDFCRRVGIDAKRSIYAGLCMEEMAGNIVEHGFTDGKDHMVDVRVVNRPEGLLLRIKDDCRAFNPKEKLELIDPEDVTHNIGLRMAQRFARELSYSNVLGLNVLTILL